MLLLPSHIVSTCLCIICNLAELCIGSSYRTSDTTMLHGSRGPHLRHHGSSAYAGSFSSANDWGSKRGSHGRNGDFSGRYRGMNTGRRNGQSGINAQWTTGSTSSGKYRRPYSYKRCYSCMSKEYELSWHVLSQFYVQPLNFTDNCNDKVDVDQSAIGAVQCTSACVTLVEDRFLAGQKVGQLYIRGCFDSLFKAGWNNSAVQTHSIKRLERCRRLPLGLLTGSRLSDDTFVQICTCFDDFCNLANSALMNRVPRDPFHWIFRLFIVLCVYCQPFS